MHLNGTEDATVALATLAAGGAVHTWWARKVTPRLMARRARRVFRDGIAPVDGVTDGVPPAARRLMNVEALSATTARSVISLQGSFDSFRDETRGRLDDLFNAVTATYHAADETRREVKPNGGDSPSIGDTIVRMAKRSGDFVEPTDPPEHNRREGDAQ